MKDATRKSLLISGNLVADKYITANSLLSVIIMNKSTIMMCEFRNMYIKKCGQNHKWLRYRFSLFILINACTWCGIHSVIGGLPCDLRKVCNFAWVWPADLKAVQTSKTSSNIVLWNMFYSFGHHVLRCWTMFYEVWFLSNILSNIVKHFFCSRVWWRMFDSFGQPVKHCWIHARALGWA